MELARGSDHGETILALLALGRHLEISEAETGLAARPTPKPSPWRSRWGDLPAQVELHAAIAQLAVYRADWAQVEESTAASADLAEREGWWASSACPTSCAGCSAGARATPPGPASSSARAHELAGQVGWSELAFQALFGLAVALRDDGDLSGAVLALDQAVDVCERAGLIAQWIQATAFSGWSSRSPAAARRRED